MTKAKESMKGSDSSSSKDDHQQHSNVFHSSHPRPSTLRALFGIAVALLSAGGFYYFFVLANMPPLDDGDWEYIKLPQDLEDTKQLARVLLKYRDEYYFSVLGLWMITFILAQSFVIPITVFLCILSGTLFSPSYLALVYVCTAAAFGAAGCYLNSKFFLKDFVVYYFPRRCQEWTDRVQRHQHNMLFFMIFLRATPLLPNWFINVASPVIGVDPWSFWLGTFIGVAPPCLLYVEAGSVLEELTTTGDVVSLASILRVSIVATLALLPVFFKEKLKRKIE